MSLNVAVKEKEHVNSDSVEMLKSRISELAPLISKNSADSEKNRRVSEETIKALKDAGVFKLMQPKRYGGYEGSIRDHLDVTSLIAESCGGAGWVTALVNVCSFFSGLFCERAQEDVYGPNPDALLAGVFSPSADTERVEGGLRVSGKWYASSGSLHADWALCGVLEHDDKGNVAGQYMALFPMEQAEIEDTWFTCGMRASGSNCIVAKDIVVPDHRLLDMSKVLVGEPATEFKDELSYRKPFMSVAGIVLVGAQLGLARAALKIVKEGAHKRAITYTTFQKQSDSAVFKALLGEAAAKIDTAHAIAYAAADMIDQAGDRCELLDFQTRAKLRTFSSVVVENVTEALSILINNYGAGAFAEFCPLQRIWRDSNAAARHSMVLPQVSYEVYGESLLGAENSGITYLV